MRFWNGIIAALGLLILAGCSSYHPLYSKGADGVGVETSLSSVAVPEQHSRSAQLIRNELLTSMGLAAARYSLKYEVTEKTVDVSSLSASNLHRKRFNLSVHFELSDFSSGNVVHSGDVFSNVSYDTIRQPVADLEAANAAMQRAAQEVAQDVRQRVAAYFSDHRV